MADWVVEPLREDHDKGAFCCGKPPLDIFLHLHAVPNVLQGVSKVYVATPRGRPHVVGYYASCTSMFEPAELPHGHRVRTPSVPAIHLGRMATDKGYARQGVGAALMLHFFECAERVSRLTAVYAVDVLAKDESAAAFYERFGFMELVHNPYHLFMTMDRVRAFLASAGRIPG